MRGGGTIAGALWCVHPRTLHHRLVTYLIEIGSESLEGSA